MKEEAWKFIEYITSYDVWRMWIARHGGPMPTRMDVCYDAPEFDDPRWEVILEAFPYAKSVRRFPSGQKYLTASRT